MAEVDMRAAREQHYAAFQKITLADRAARHAETASRKSEEMEMRRALGAAYLDEHPSDIVVSRERAVTTVNLVDETAAARDEACRLNDGRTAKFNNGALEFPVLGHEFAADGPTVALGTTPLILAPVVHYLGMMPVLFNMFVTRAHTTEFLPGAAHRFHLDPEDTWSFKVFVHLTDVDSGCGPFHALPADFSTTVLEAVDYRGVSYLDDEQVANLVGWDNVVEVIGPPGTVALADTTRCLHFGGRPRAAGKPVREMLVFQYLLPTSTLLSPDGDTPVRRFLPQLTVRGENWWDALVG